MSFLKLLGPDQSTVLFDFDDPSGAANPSTVITDLSTGLDLGTIEPENRIFAYDDYGASRLGASHPPMEAAFGFKARAATDDALWAGLGQLGRYLTSVAVDHPLFLSFLELTEVRYLDVIGILQLPALLRGQGAGSLIALKKDSLGPIPIRLLIQPWKRGPSVTTSGVTVPDDPATSTKCRVYPLTVTGDLPTPGRVRVQVDSGATTQRIVIGHRALKSRVSSFFADGLSDTYFLQLEATAANRGWTGTHGTDTSATTDANASPGSSNTIARVTHSSNPTLLQRRTRHTRTTKMDSLRGAWDVWCRVKGNGARDYRLQLRWGPSTADPAINVMPEVRHDLSSSPAAFGYVEKKLGRIYFPETVPLAGCALEVWTRQASGTATNLDLDLLWLVPANAATVVVPGGSSDEWLGSQLASPPAQITGDPAWTAGTVAASGALSMNAANEGCGTPPNAGIVWGVGRHEFVFSPRNFLGTFTYKHRVVNITDNTEVASFSEAMTNNYAQGAFLSFDGVAGKAYQAQSVITAYTSGRLDIELITHQFSPTLASGESARTEPLRLAVDRLDGSGNLAAYLGVEGKVPVMLEPGDNHLFIRCDEVPLTSYSEGENKLARTPTVTVAYDPRYAI